MLASLCVVAEVAQLWQDQGGWIPQLALRRLGGGGWELLRTPAGFGFIKENATTKWSFAKLFDRSLFDFIGQAFTHMVLDQSFCLGGHQGYSRCGVCCCCTQTFR